MQDLLDRMCRRILRHAEGIRWETPLPRVGIGVLRPHAVPAAATCRPGVCLVVQGAKQMLVGERLLRYGAGSCFASLIELPSTRCVFEAEEGRPYAATSLKLDRDAFTALLADLPPAVTSKTALGFSVATASRELLEAWDHFLALLDTPDDIPVLAASRERELLYRLLQSPHGAMLRQIARDDDNLSRVRRAIEWMRHHFDQPLAIDTLAKVAGMSLSSFNRHFRAATSTSPLQYQKTLRLQAARGLLANNADAARAAYAVGYESASQFSREYSRLFGLSPKQDALRMRTSMRNIENLMI